MDTLLELIREELGGLEGLALRVASSRLRRLIDELAPPAILPADAPSVRAQLPPMSEQEQSEYGRAIMGYGAHHATCRSLVPRHYLEWLEREKYAEWSQLWRYLRATLPAAITGDFTGATHE